MLFIFCRCLTGALPSAEKARPAGGPHRAHPDLPHRPAAGFSDCALWGPARRGEPAAESRAAAGRDPQSRLNISFEEAQKVIEDYSGTGIIRVKKDGTAADVEFITCKTTLGEYFENGKWYETKRAAIHHGKKGFHIVPVKENIYV